MPGPPVSMHREGSSHDINIHCIDIDIGSDLDIGIGWLGGKLSKAVRFRPSAERSSDADVVMLM